MQMKLCHTGLACTDEKIFHNQLTGAETQMDAHYDLWGLTKPNRCFLVILAGWTKMEIVCCTKTKRKVMEMSIKAASYTKAILSRGLIRQVSKVTWMGELRVCEDLSSESTKKTPYSNSKTGSAIKSNTREDKYLIQPIIALPNILGNQLWKTIYRVNVPFKPTKSAFQTFLIYTAPN